MRPATILTACFGMASGAAFIRSINKIVHTIDSSVIQGEVQVDRDLAIENLQDLDTSALDAIPGLDLISGLKAMPPTYTIVIEPEAGAEVSNDTTYSFDGSSGVEGTLFVSTNGLSADIAKHALQTTAGAAGCDCHCKCNGICFGLLIFIGPLATICLDKCNGDC